MLVNQWLALTLLQATSPWLVYLSPYKQSHFQNKHTDPFFFQRHSYASSRDFIFLPVSCIGPEFESRIRQNEINNPKFNFLNPGDPYHAYFQQKIADIKEQDGKGENARMLGKNEGLVCMGNQNGNA